MFKECRSRKFDIKKALKQAAIFLAIIGPGIITGSVDNDAGGITVYSVAGAKYGYGLIWTLIPSFHCFTGNTGDECTGWVL